jgi:hypothetical protein
MSALKIVGMCLFLLLGLESVQAQDDLIKVGEITNEIRIGQFAGNRNLAFGVKNILEEILMDSDYSLSPTAENQINIKLVFFDIKNIGTNVAVFHKDVSITQIIAIGELQVKGKVKKKTTQKGESSEISTSTLVVADDGTFNQQTASIALKKVCVQIVEELLK